VRNFSIIFLIIGESDIGRLSDGLDDAGTLGTGITIAVFHASGKLLR
jgi:hypothetical protein